MKAHVPLGFDVTSPIACISKDLKHLSEVVVYLPPNPHPKSEEALNSLKSYLNAVNVKLEVLKLDPCSPRSIFEIIIYMNKDNLICAGSGFRAFGLLLLLACVISKRRCLLRTSLEAGGPCLEVEVNKLLELKTSEAEALALALALINGKVSPSDLERFGIDKRVAWRYINELVDRGVLRKEGRGRYVPSERVKNLL